MRIFGFLLIFVGLVAAFGYPTYHDTFNNFEVGKYTIYDDGSGFRNQTVWLAPEDGPISVMFDFAATTRQSLEQENAEFGLNVLDAETQLHELSFNFAELGVGNTNIAESPAGVSLKINSLPITKSALHTFSFTGNALDISAVSTITMTLTGLALQLNRAIPNAGYGLLGIGALIYLIGGRRHKRTRRGNAPMGKRSKTSQIGRRTESENRSQSSEDRPEHKWGRGAD